jgi:hypothetical protein
MPLISVNLHRTQRFPPNYSFLLNSPRLRRSKFSLPELRSRLGSRWSLINGRPHCATPDSLARSVGGASLNAVVCMLTTVAPQTPRPWSHSWGELVPREPYGACEFHKST